MMRQIFVELVVGVFIIIVILALIFLGVKVSGLTGSSAGAEYTVTADFDNVGDLKVRAPVSIAGVHIGQIASITLDPKTFEAIVTMKIQDKANKIPVDSTANIYTEGLLGSNYISLSPGYSNTNLKNGGVIENTNPALILQNLIGQLLFSLKGGDNKVVPPQSSGGATPAANTSLNLGG